MLVIFCYILLYFGYSKNNVLKTYFSSLIEKLTEYNIYNISYDAFYIIIT